MSIRSQNTRSIGFISVVSSNPTAPPLDRPFVKGVFPATEFVDKDFQVSGDFGATASIGFGQLAEVIKKFVDLKLDIKGELKLQFSYKPKVAKIHSGASGSSCHWHFERAGGTYPVGGLQLKAIIIRPRKLAAMEAHWEVRVEFDRLGPFDSSVMAPGKTILEFIPSQSP